MVTNIIIGIAASTSYDSTDDTPHYILRIPEKVRYHASGDWGTKHMCNKNTFASGIAVKVRHEKLF